MKQVNFIVLAFVLGVASSNVYVYFTKPKLEPLPVVTSTIHTTAERISLLHYLKIGSEKDAEDILEEKIMEDAIFVNLANKEVGITKEQHDLMLGQFALLFVMNEKFNISTWKSNDEFKGILKETQKMNPEKLEWFRCQDWSKPMWVGNNCNKTNSEKNDKT